jgi:hypothetical protein
MTRVYIAGPMTGLPDFNYPAFNEAAEQLKAAGFEPLNPAAHGLPTNLHRSVYLKAGLRLMLDADKVALLPGYQNSPGAQLELHVAVAVGIEPRTLGAWLAGES